MTTAAEDGRRRRGRPKGRGPARLPARVVVPASFALAEWLASFAQRLGTTRAGAVREALRRTAELVGYEPPPLR